MLLSCNKEKNFSFKKKDKENIPDKIFIETTISLKEKGSLKLFIYSPIIKDYTFYTIFPNGLELFIYEKKNTNKYTYISAKWVKSIERTFYHLKGKIKIINPKGYMLKTEEIYWNVKKKKIYNDKYTIISSIDGTVLHAKNGIEASDDFKKIILKNISGTIYIK
ncbi:hypothetical protein [Blattabacterium cuenoti]|uniref:hypothetical protein n=1 Tax=Blattabacterium cuenoti TaxID=1653831 RepID=UPI001EEC3965|nr:hypothetical protein [Blattabacterium cuenoti]